MKFIPPRRLPEANIQAEAYRQLRNNNIKCCLEYRIYIPDFNSYIRADIAIIKDDEVILLIECKSRKRNKSPNKDGRQYKKYKSLGIPILYCMDFKEAQNILDDISPFLI